MWISRGPMFLYLLASFAAGEAPISIASMDFRLIDFDTVGNHRLDTMPLSQLAINLVLAPIHSGLDSARDGSKTSECSILPDQHWTAEGWGYCSSSTYVRIKRRTGAENFEMELEAVHFEFESTLKYPDARLNVHHLSTTLAANATGQAPNHLTCERRRQDKDVVCKTGLPAKTDPIPPFTRRSAAVELERLHVRSLTVLPPRPMPQPSDMFEVEGNLSVRVRSPTRAFVVWDLLNRTAGTQDSSNCSSSSSSSSSKSGGSVADGNPTRDGESECAGTYQCGRPHQHGRSCWGRLNCPATSSHDGSLSFNVDAAGRPGPLFLSVGYTFDTGVGHVRLEWPNMLFRTEKEKDPWCEPDNCGKCGENGCVWERETGWVIDSIDFQA